MNIQSIAAQNLQSIKPLLLRFVAKYGERRITLEALRWLQQMNLETLANPGTELLIAREGTRLTGLSGVSGYGRNIAFVVVHPDYRGKGIGRELIRSHLNRLKAFSCTVALDNQASIRMCSGAGLKPVFYRRGTAGKPVVVFKAYKKEGEAICLGRHWA